MSHSSNQRHRSRSGRGNLVGRLLGAASLLAITAAAPSAFALTITGTFTGGSFSAVPYFTCGETWNCADPATRSPSVAPTAQWVVDTVEAAARYWERRIDDPWTVAVTYGFTNLGSGPGSPQAITFGTAAVDGRLTAATVRFNSTVPDWFLSPTPGRNLEYQPMQVVTARLGSSTPTGTSVTTGITTTAIPFGPASVPTVLCGAVPCGAHQDLLSLAIHELAHVLNVNTSTLLPLQASPSMPFTLGGSATEVSLMVIPQGPLKGTTMPWTPAGGGHPFLKPSPGDAPIVAPPSGFPANWLDSPSGNVASNAVIFYGPHRKLVSDLDAVIVASVSNFRRVNLDTVHYVALPEFTGATTPQLEHGVSTTLLTVNGVATLAPRPDPSGLPASSLRLTPDAASSSGSAFLTKPFDMSAEVAFRTSFRFKIDGVNGSGPLGSDGFAFVVHRDARGAAALGNGGEGLGYGRGPTFGDSVPGIRSSLAIEFDTHANGFDPNDNHIAFVLNGDVANHAALFSPDFALNDGREHFVWIEYDPTTDLLSLYLADSDSKPEAASLSQVIDLSGLWGPAVYFGFTAATGGGFNSHDILSWNLEVAAVPENDPLLLLASGLIVLALANRRTRGAAGPAMAS